MGVKTSVAIAALGCIGSAFSAVVGKNTFDPEQRGPDLVRRRVLTSAEEATAG